MKNLDPEDEAFEELSLKQGHWQHTSGWRKKQILETSMTQEALAENAMRKVQRLGQEIEQEPVALPCCGYTDASAVKWNPFNNVVQCHNCGQVYTSQPQRKPLTDKAITKVIDSMPKKMKGFGVDWDLYEFARAIEAAHGIKENT
jgi:hypothetical protein